MRSLRGSVPPKNKSPSVGTPGCISSPEVRSESLLKLVSWSCWKKKHDWYSTITTPLWSCYGFCPSLKSPFPLRAISPPPTRHLQECFDLMSFSLVRQKRISLPIFNPGNMSRRLPNRKHPRISADSLRLRGETELRVNPLKESHRKLTSYVGATWPWLGSCNVKLDPSVENAPQTFILYQLIITRQEEQRPLPTGRSNFNWPTALGNRDCPKNTNQSLDYWSGWTDCTSGLLAKTDPKTLDL